ncbi:MAG: hypothetical protein R3288_13135, partial [Woeseiaceae bacterium]|nr:hypothetical protein [Woeseiaceae bacterium]
RLRIANQSMEQFVLKRSAILLVDAAGIEYKAVASDEIAKALDRDLVPYAVLGFGGFSAKSVEDANAAMRADWASKSLPEPALFGGRDARDGFVFFLAEGGLPDDAELTLVFEGFLKRDSRTVLVPLQSH